MLKHLVPGARVILSQNGVELGETDAPGVTHTFAVPALKAGATVEAWMALCNGESPKASIQVGADAVTTGIGISPPYACGSFVDRRQCSAWELPGVHHEQERPANQSVRESDRLRS